jgi:phosphotransferase system enzyme I (PtsI)
VTQEIVHRAVEATRIGPAMQAVAAELRARAEEETKKVLEATSHMAEDFGLRDLAETGVTDRGLTAARAVFEAANTFRDMLAAAGGYIGARVADVEDVRDRIIAAVLGVPMPGIPEPGHPFILAARDLAPAERRPLIRRKSWDLLPLKGARRATRRSLPAGSAYRRSLRARGR